MKITGNTRGIKIAKEENNKYQVFFYYANNAGRGNNNCTIVKVKNGINRPAYSRQIKESDILAKKLTSSWSGHINLSKRIQEYIGIENDNLVVIE